MISEGLKQRLKQAGYRKDPELTSLVEACAKGVISLSLFREAFNAVADEKINEKQR